MIIWIIAICVIFLLVTSYFKRYKEADEKTLQRMQEWAVIANSSTLGNRERMAYSLIIQAGTILEKLNILELRILRNLMVQPKFNKSNFVLLIISAAPNIIPEKAQESLKNSFKEQQARVYLATCIETVLLYGGTSDLEKLAKEACCEPLDWT